LPSRIRNPGSERQVLLKFLAAGICGSDLPGFPGTQGKLPGDVGPCAAGIDGFDPRDRR
jgi:threonine dehydrogenase-like Zn-dependent dehydrogenase